MAAYCQRGGVGADHLVAGTLARVQPRGPQDCLHPNDLPHDRQGAGRKPVSGVDSPKVSERERPSRQAGIAHSFSLHVHHE